MTDYQESLVVWAGGFVINFATCIWALRVSYGYVSVNHLALALTSSSVPFLNLVWAVAVGYVALSESEFGSKILWKWSKK